MGTPGRIAYQVARLDREYVAIPGHLTGPRQDQVELFLRLSMGMGANTGLWWELRHIDEVAAAPESGATDHTCKPDQPLAAMSPHLREFELIEVAAIKQ
jgi:hypothetical protein